MEYNNTIEQKLESLAGYFYSVERDTVNGWYFIKIGIPTKWVVYGNDSISYETVIENEAGKLIKIFPLKAGVIVDDLVEFSNVVLQNNKEIEKREQEFMKKMEEIKSNLDKEAQSFYRELEEMKKNVFSPQQTDTVKKKKNPKKETVIEQEQTSDE